MDELLQYWEMQHCTQILGLLASAMMNGNFNSGIHWVDPPSLGMYRELLYPTHSFV